MKYLFCLLLLVGCHPSMEPLQYAGGTAEVLCGPFRGVRVVKSHTIEQNYAFSSETVKAYCNDGSTVERHWIMYK